MTDRVPEGRAQAGDFAGKILTGTGVLWFMTAVIGQWIFAYYIIGYFGPLIIEGGVNGLSKSHLPNGFVAGDLVGNIAVIVHLLLAFIITVGGPLQLTPQIRNRFPKFHHWNGRVYITTAFIISLGALYMVWTRGTISGTTGDISISINGILIMICAAMTLRYAMARKIHIHHRWAMRLFLVVSGVWFFRIGLMAWFALTGGIGINTETFRGPFLDFLGFGQYVIPLIVLEIYLRIRENAGRAGKLLMAACMIGITALTGLGIFAATMGMWLPRL